MIVVIDYGMGNIASVANMLKKAGAKARIDSDPAAVASAQALILPGVGAFDQGMESLERRGWLAPLGQWVRDRRPILGICLGMQLLAEGSDEGSRPGLGWIAGRARRFDFSASGERRPVPHMGWNTLRATRPGRLLEGLAADARFYFVHSYYLDSASPDAAGETAYGHPFCSVVERDSVFGVQFHPEKSHKFGLQLLSRFARL